ncbi:TPA: ComEC family protein [Yersinia enterocolitica]|uniref:ComEC family protein n=1 Tax=Yersinia enterocolitica TaxID=630 RepID=UPI00285830AF|nr:ComEC family protein [Yersinia enterocolitica]EKN4017225.1 ComEC family protein [Yersinia enterocolitica]EKN4193076.1 ComEC family protein [Yersinia enterocolitica]EKN4749731.1 ComEC family protein [Yersinia enterocolitica]EKN4921187.1 ComEC family protein [Yersinia enterocolitica]
MFITLSIDHAALAIIAGLLPLIVLPQLPGVRIISILLILGALLWVSGNVYCQWLTLALVSFVWGCCQGDNLLMQIDQLTHREQQVVATINTSHLAWVEGNRVLLDIQQVNGKRVFPTIKVTVAWQKGLNYCAGQQWKLWLRMRGVHSLLNEGGFDSQRWAITNRRPLQGRIIRAELLDASCNARQQTIRIVEQQLEPYRQRQILLALAFGERSQLDPQYWTLLRDTGTAHLMAISGLHIAMAALFGGMLARGLQFLLPVSRIGPLFPLITSWLVAVIYAWLAGANPPAVRATMALTLWLLLRLFCVSCSAWQIWLWALALILLSDPLAILSDSFWLSCLAVFSLICWFYWVPLAPRFRTGWQGLVIRGLHLQLGMMLLLMPLQIVLFHGISLFSIPANLWAVPLVSLITVPCVLLALVFTLLPSVAGVFWWLADLSLTAVLLPLNPMRTGWFYTGSASAAIGFGGWLAMLIWRFAWWRNYYIGVMVLCVNLVLFTQRRDEYQWRVDMLDIGHGLAVVIEREGKAIIFDTGNRWGTGSMASKVILPYLRWRGITIEQIILSHDHQDHTGGVAEIQAAFPMATVRAPFPLKYAPNVLPCKQGLVWQWQGLNFEVLWPREQIINAQNDDSCVIRIDDGKHSLLLTGDLEMRGEKALIKDSRTKLASTLLQVPHHGSNTSSTPPFLRAVKPELAFASVARYNQWHLPARKVTQRYQKNNIIWRDTSVSGQLSVYFYSDGWQINGYREQLMPRWYHQQFGVGGHNE